jgi:YfiH family protein
VATSVARHAVSQPLTVALPWGARVLVTSRADGDLRPPGVPDDAAEARRRVLVDRPWTFARQVHGARVVVVGAPSGPLDAEADALVTASPDACLAVLGADCALVGLASPEGITGVAHAGWRGLVAGIVEATVAAMRSLGAGRVAAVLGPCIHPECYRFGEADLDAAAAVLGPAVRATTAAGDPALDLPAAVRGALARAGAELAVDAGSCTACGDRWFSHRRRRDASRHALAVWQEAPAAGSAGGR